MVLAILAVAALVIGPAMVRQSALGVRREVRADVAQLLRETRLAATRSGVPVQARYLPNDRALEAWPRPESATEASWPRPVMLPDGWTVWSPELNAHLERAAIRAANPEPFTLVVFHPKGLASRSAWLVRGPGGEVSVETDAIDGLRVE
jgi:type II secretory pathway pseudopilin PulG